MYELSVLRPAISGLMPEYSWACRVLEDDRRRAVLRAAPKLSASLFRVRRRARRAGAVVRGGSHHPSSLSRRAREERRAVFVHADSRMIGMTICLVRSAPIQTISRSALAARSRSTRRSDIGRSLRLDPRRDGEQRIAGRARAGGRRGAKVLGRRHGAKIWRCQTARSEVSGAHAQSVVELIRRARPRAVALPYWQDRHPDHPMHPQ